MNIQKTERLLTAMMGIAAMSMTAASVAGPQTAAKPALAKTVPAVIIKLGDAMLEEYQGGNPASRTTVFTRRGSRAKGKKCGQWQETFVKFRRRIEKGRPNGLPFFACFSCECFNVRSDSGRTSDGVGIV